MSALPPAAYGTTRRHGPRRIVLCLRSAVHHGRKRKRCEADFHESCLRKWRATGYHMRLIDRPLRSPALSAICMLSWAAPRTPRPVLSATSRPPIVSCPAAGPPTSRADSSPTDVGPLHPALRSRTGWRGGLVAGEFVARSEPNAIRCSTRYQRARRQSRLQGRTCPTTRQRVRADRLRLQFAAAAGGESRRFLPIRAGARRLGEKQSGQAHFAHSRRRTLRTLPMNCSRWKLGIQASTSPMRAERRRSPR